MNLQNLENKMEGAMGIMRRRMVGRAVVRTAATTAVVVGTAAVVGGAVSGSKNQPAPQAAPAAAAAPEVVYVQAPAEPVAAAAPAAPSQDDVMAQLTQYSKMHDAGVLTDEEFAAVKAKLLGI